MSDALVQGPCFENHGAKGRRHRRRDQGLRKGNVQTKATLEKLKTSWSPVLDKTRREPPGKHPEWGQAGMLPLEAPQGTPATCSAGLTQGHSPTGTSRPHWALNKRGVPEARPPVGCTPSCSLAVSSFMCTQCCSLMFLHREIDGHISY